MKILLLTPPGLRMMNPETLEPDLPPPKTWAPLGIATLAAVLRRAGYAPALRDLHDDGWDEVEALLREKRPDLVGISCFTFERTNALRTAALVRQLLPQALVVMGGPHATFFPEQLLQTGLVDVVALGEGEKTLLELVRRLEDGRDLRNLPGIALRHTDGLRSNPPGPRTDCLDELPFPDYSAFDLAEYKSPEVPERHQASPGAHALTSRGCPYTCRFCSVNNFFGGRWAFRSPGNVADELEQLVADRGVRHVYFSDDLFTLNRERAIGICREIINRKIDLAWMAETRVDCVDAGLLGWMRRAGCHRVYYGVESGSPRILKAVNKRFTVAQVARTFELTHKAGLEPCCFLMVGNPGESPETIGETVELIQAIRPAATPIIGITTILPGTELYELSKKPGAHHGRLLAHRGQPAAVYRRTGRGRSHLSANAARPGVSPEMYGHLCAMGFDEGCFRLRRLGSRMFGEGSGLAGHS